MSRKCNRSKRARTFEKQIEFAGLRKVFTHPSHLAHRGYKKSRGWCKRNPWPYVFILVLLVSCAPIQYDRGHCQHEALVAAMVYMQEYEVRIAYGQMRDGSAAHVQAQAFIDGQWRWLQCYPRTFRAEVGEADDFEPEMYFNLKRYFQQVLYWSE